MNTTKSEAAPVDLGVSAPSGSRFEPTNHLKGKSMSILNPTTDVDEPGRFTGDHYERLMQGAEVLASDPAMIDASPPFNHEGMLAFAGSIREARLLDGLSDHDADTVIMLSILDFTRGLPRMAWRLTDWLSDEPTLDRGDDDFFAVVQALAGIFHMTVGAFVEGTHTEADE